MAEPVQLLFSWATLRSAGIGYAMAATAKARADHPGAVCLCVLDAGEDAGLALSALRSGADKVRFSGAPELAEKLAQIADQLDVEFEASRLCKDRM